MGWLHHFARRRAPGHRGFHSGQEALHRVAWMGQATVLAQAVGLGATWNTDLVRWAGEAVCTETRAMRARDDQVGLNLRSPKTRSVDLFVGDGPVLVVLTLLPGTAEPHGFADKALDQLVANAEEVTVSAVARAARVHRSDLADLRSDLAERGEDLAAARAANRDLMARLNR